MIIAWLNGKKCNISTVFGSNDEIFIQSVRRKKAKQHYRKKKRERWWPVKSSIKKNKNVNYKNILELFFFHPRCILLYCLSL